MTTPDTGREPDAAHLRIEVARLVVAITDSWPGEHVLADRRQLALTTEDAVRQVAKVRRQLDEFKTSVAELCRQRDTRNTELEELRADNERYSERLRELGPIVDALRERMAGGAL
jgi:septal ring factor EnvC (AmiA/AmiB activator)